MNTRGSSRFFVCSFLSWEGLGHRKRKRKRKEIAELGTCRVRRLTASQALAIRSFILSSEVVQASSAVVSGKTLTGMDNGRDSRKNTNIEPKNVVNFGCFVFSVLPITDVATGVKTDRRKFYQRNVVATCNIWYCTECIGIVFIHHLTLLFPFVGGYHFT